LTNPNLSFPSSKNLEKILGATGTFSIESSLDSEWISNEKSEKSLGLEFNEI
jgi:hypothetical protein